MRLLPMLVCLPAMAPACALGQAGGAGPTSQPHSLSLATYNINFGNPNLKAVAEAVRKAAADVILFQETNAISTRFLVSQFSKAYRWRRFYAANNVAGGFGVLSRLPIVRTRVIPAKEWPFDAFVTDVAHPGGVIQLVNLHLMPTIPPSDCDLAGLTRLFLQAEAVRDREIRYIMSHVALARNRPTIVAGDLNSLPSLMAPSYLLKCGFSDSFAAVTPDADAHPTWHWTDTGRQLQARFDYIFHDARFKTTDSKVVRTEGSDHFLVVSRMELQPPTPTSQAQP